MRKILFALAVLFGSAVCAQAASNPTLVYPVCISSFTVSVISVSSTTSVQIDTPTLAGRVVMEIQDLDPAANLWCDNNGGLGGSSTGTVKIGRGREITPGNSWTLNIADNFTRFTSNPVTTVPVHIYCVNDSSSASTNAAVSQCF